MCLNNLCSSSPGLHKNWARSGYTDTPHLGCLAVLGILIRCIKCSLAALLGEMNEFESKLKGKMTKWWPGMKRIANMKKCDIPQVSVVQMLWCRAVAVTAWCCRVEWYWYKYLYGYGYGYENMRIWDVRTSSQYCPISLHLHTKPLFTHIPKF